MLSPIQKIIFNDFKDFVDVFLSIFKFGIGLGATCLIYYLIEIEYLPNEISLGDGFVLFFIAIVFAVFLLFFILAEIVLGMIVWNSISFIFFKVTSHYFREKLNSKFNKILGLKKDKNNFLKLKMKKTSYIFLLPLLLIPMVLFNFEVLGLIWSILIGLTVYLFLNIIYTLSIEYNYFDRFKNYTDNEEDSQLYKGIITKINIKNSENKNTVKISILIIVFVPIIYSGYYFNIPFKLISSTMNLVSMRKESSTIYVKREYAEIILGSKAVSSQANYYPISKVTILFKGVGKNTYLQVEQNKIIQRLDVPNDAILSTVIIKEDQSVASKAN